MGRKISNSTRILAAGLAVLLHFAASCSERDVRESTTAIEGPGEILAASRTLQLEEREGVITVALRVEIDPSGDLLVVDVTQAKLRRYGPSGELKWQVGRKGDGPGEFRSPIGVGRQPSGPVVVIDMDGRISRFAADGSGLLDTHATPFQRVEDLRVLDDSLVLIAGILGTSAGPRLHVWNTVSEDLVRSFYAPFAGTPNPAAATMAGWTKADLRADTVAAIFATSDTVSLFRVDGTFLRAVPLPTALFRRVTREPPANPSDMSWLETFDLVENVHWLSDGTLAVSYQGLHWDSIGAKISRDHHLLHLAAAGERLAEWRNIPEILAISSGDSVYFVDPVSLTSDHLRVGPLR